MPRRDTARLARHSGGKVASETKNNWYVANGIITHNCRCVIAPWFDIEGGTRESADGYVSDKVTFEDWLKAQDEKTQRDVLGRTRFELFKKGEKIEQFVEGGEALTLKELNAKINIQEKLNTFIVEPDIKKLSKHLEERMKERGISVEDIKDTVSNPLVRKPLRDDGTYQEIGEKVTIGVSGSDGTITTAWRTSRRKAKKLLKEQKK